MNFKSKLEDLSSRLLSGCSGMALALALALLLELGVFVAIFASAGCDSESIERRYAPVGIWVTISVASRILGSLEEVWSTLWECRDKGLGFDFDFVDGD